MNLKDAAAGLANEPALMLVVHTLNLLVVFAPKSPTHFMILVKEPGISWLFYHFWTI